MALASYAPNLTKEHKMLRNPLLSKILIISLMALLLLIPLTMIQSKVTERQFLQQGVQQDIARSASGPQTIAGPFLVLKYQETIHSTIKDNTGNEKVSIHKVNGETILKPISLTIDGSADVETRSRGIYQARLFNLHSEVMGTFEVPKGYGLNKPLADITPIAAFFVVKVSDARGIRNIPLLKVNENKFEFKPGNIGATLSGNGIHVPLKTLNLDEVHTLHFEFPLELQGMSTLTITPSGGITEMSLQSSWPHPSFGGSYLPRARSVTGKGFTAQWMVSNLARNQGTTAGNNHQVGAETFSVSFINPVNIYVLSERAVKYSVLFIVLVFAGFFMFEILRSLRIHPMQYMLVGLALAIFFLLIISLSEHIPFLSAYAISGTMCVALIGFYLAGVLKDFRPALAFSVAIALLYAVLYGVLQSEDNALLMGTLLIFVALASMMMLSRKIDWYSFNNNQLEKES